MSTSDAGNASCVMTGLAGGAGTLPPSSRARPPSFTPSFPATSVGLTPGPRHRPVRGTKTSMPRGAVLLARRPTYHEQAIHTTISETADLFFLLQHKP